MVVDALPQDTEAVLGRVFNDSFQRHAVASLGGTKSGRGRRDSGFEGVGPGRVDGDKGDFGDHGVAMARF